MNLKTETMTDVVAHSEVTETAHHPHVAEIEIGTVIANVIREHLRLLRNQSQNLPAETPPSLLFEHPQLPPAVAKK